MKKERIPKLLHHTLSRFITKHLPINTFGAMITITHIYITPNQTLAKIYLSFLPTHPQEDPAPYLKQIIQAQPRIKKYVGNALSNQLRTIPELQFHIDDSAKQAIAMDQLLSTLTP